MWVFDIRAEYIFIVQGVYVINYWHLSVRSLFSDTDLLSK